MSTMEKRCFCITTLPESVASSNARKISKDTLNVWPVLPLVIQGSVSTSDVDDTISGLERRSNTLSKIDLSFPSSQLEDVSAAVQVPFPELTDIQLGSNETASEPVLPNSLLGGSIPRLRYLQLRGISFLGLLKLLLSATHLVHLHLYHIPHSGYISPEAMVAGLSVLNSLENLRLDFESPQARPSNRENCRSSPLIRSFFPILSRFGFKGPNEFLEDLVALIDAPRLCVLEITFFRSLDFDTRQIVQFISRTPSLKTPDEARVIFQDSAVWVRFLHYRHLATEVEVSMWEFHAACQIGSIPLWNRSVRPLCLLSLRWRTSTSTNINICDDFGKTISKTSYGWNHCIHLLP